MNLTKDVIIALEIAEKYLELGDWVDIRTVKNIVHMNIGTVHSNGFIESARIIIIIRDGIILKHLPL